MFCEMVTSHQIESINQWKAVTPASHLLIGELYTADTGRNWGLHSKKVRSTADQVWQQEAEPRIDSDLYCIRTYMMSCEFEVSTKGSHPHPASSS